MVYKEVTSSRMEMEMPRTTTSFHGVVGYQNPCSYGRHQLARNCPVSLVPRTDDFEVYDEGKTGALRRCILHGTVPTP